MHGARGHVLPAGLLRRHDRKHSPDGKKIRNDRDFAAHLLEHADLAVFPGEDFGLSPYIRVSFANPPELIEETRRRLRRACQTLR